MSLPAFVCPDCHSVHAEPAEAFYLLAVRCCDCELRARFYDEIETAQPQTAELEIAELMTAELTAAELTAVVPEAA